MGDIIVGEDIDWGVPDIEGEVFVDTDSAPDVEPDWGDSEVDGGLAEMDTTSADTSSVDTSSL